MTSRWSRHPGRPDGPAYAARFDDLAARGHDVHGEATFVAGLAPPGARVLDAGCGTGRVATRLAELGYRCVGVDVDESMLAVARERSPDLPWVTADLAALSAGDLEPAQLPFDVAVAAGNVVPLVGEGTEAEVVRRLAALLRPGGLLVAGFGLDRAHLPPGTPPVDLRDYDRWCAAAGLVLDARLATWEGAASGGPEDTGGYAVSVHRAS